MELRVVLAKWIQSFLIDQTSRIGFSWCMNCSEP